MYTLRSLIIISLIAGFAGHAPAEDATQACASTALVVSTIDSGSYTYAQLDIGGSNVWYAVPATELTPGEKVYAPAGMLMKNFYSKTLDRTFETVYFAEGIQPIEAENNATCPLPAGHPSIQGGLPAGHPAIDGTLPPGHPPVDATTNSACCTRTNAPSSCCMSTNTTASSK